ncbi:PhzF family phenazine biosynthesis protein [Lentimicrobium sp.]|nr:PhzF family phenazine biosynthesis protein [Lentimicrobium sp.]MCO5255763.1 PhzF family phenazine biosynthesis protein [Lentimicrobium sp.]MCO5263369.1 PhzF family phenazine biosynthesis protein [Lentimicrobium sp.]HOP14343.1 PhzF family phenazine biosynthesis protein [Lentimicrobium sp.]HPF64645.1 PhzF family phenazine biosynthesis protein [Lentimicrobium sp.]HPJ62994.1 PhzF family phenazine biosynthesis protein [Lentimicrobium sp.]
MEKISIFQVDAFTGRLFEGNPAAVCPLDQWLPAALMQDIAAENNLAETAFIVPAGKEYEIRWFTPAVEVDLCGHATLASAYVLFEYLGYPGQEIIFHSARSGMLKVSRRGDLLLMDFPSDILERVSLEDEIQAAIGLRPLETWKGRSDLIALLEDESAVKQLSPDFTRVNQLDCRGLIVTAAGDTADFVSRFFGPRVGINEDPVTGSAHTSLTPLWSARLGKKELTARQLSKRGGSLRCTDLGARCLIGGEAKLYLTGEINIA